jgi:hypothetical protein
MGCGFNKLISLGVLNRANIGLGRWYAIYSESSVRMQRML